jgi:quinol monooxygenase YgiN
MSAHPVTFVNVFDVAPERHEELADLLSTALDQVIRHRPGFVEARVLVSLDGTTVINEATWADAESVAATREHPDAVAAAARAAELGTARAAVYRVHAEVRR